MDEQHEQTLGARRFERSTPVRAWPRRRLPMATRNSWTATRSSASSRCRGRPCTRRSPRAIFPSRSESARGVSDGSRTRSRRGWKAATAPDLPRRCRRDAFARGTERRDPRRAKGHRRVAAAARHLAVGEGRRARLGEPDVRIPAEAEVAALAVDGQPLHPVAAAAAKLHDEEERSAVAVTSRPQGRYLLDSESSCHRDPPIPSPTNMPRGELEQADRPQNDSDHGSPNGPRKD